MRMFNLNRDKKILGHKQDDGSVALGGIGNQMRARQRWGERYSSVIAVRSSKDAVTRNINQVYNFSSRALSLRNLVSGYECGRVFPAGVGPDSPSRDAANWLPSRFGLSVETRRRYGWLRMVFPGARLSRAPIWCPSEGWRHARGREQCRGESGSALSGGYAPDPAKAEGSSIVDEPEEG